MRRKVVSPAFLLCVKNDGYAESLEVRKVYQALPDPEAARHRMVRVIDESGDDYLFPKSFFVAVELSSTAKKAFAHAS
jgi:hypothetical protein